MRVANIIEEGKLGGPQIRMLMVAFAIRGEVETTIIMPTENSSAFQKRCADLGIAFQPMMISRITKDWRVALRYVLFSFLEIIKIARFLKKGKFDLVHASGGSWQYKGVLAGKLAGVKIVWHLNDTSMPSFFRCMFAFFSHFSDGFIFASERSREYYGPLMRGVKPEFMIPAPVDTAFYDPKKDYVGDESLIDSWDGDVVIGTVANINPIKGLEVFIDAVQEVNCVMKNARFVVVGPVYENQRRYFEKLQQQCSELGVKNIEFVGGREELRPLLKRFDIYVCSSHAESSPLSVWEAMAMSKPIVSTDVGDVSRYVYDQQQGFIVDVGDSHAMAERIISIAMDQSLKQHCGQQSRMSVEASLDIHRCAEKHVNAYNKMLNSHSV